jgi:hypothetical protein
LRGTLGKASPTSTAEWIWVKLIVINNLGHISILHRDTRLF